MISTQQCSSRAGTESRDASGHLIEETASRTREVHRIVHKVMALMKRERYAEKDIFGVRLVLEEAIVNGIKHGHHEDPTKQVRIRCHVTSESVLASVEDEGPGFDPDQVADPTAPENWGTPGGRGVLLMRKYTTWARYNERGNCVTMCKYRSIA
jgi:serine/threonine-protein kinase RsbW